MCSDVTTISSAPCPWCGSDPLYRAYHDEEWGRPERDGEKLWALLMLEAFQAGLSWITILRRREDFYRAFKGFDPALIAHWGEAEVAALLQDTGIIRHRGKIEAVIAAAKAYQRIEAELGFANFIWGFVDHRPIQNQRRSMSEVPAFTQESEALSKALKAQGFKFCGPTICYAFMQAAGLVNDHLLGCPQQKLCADMA